MTEFFVGGGLTTVMLNYYRQLWADPALSDQFKIDFISNNEIDDELREEIERHGCHYFQMAPRKSHLLKHYLDFRNVVKDGHYDVLHYNCNSGMDAFELAIARKYVQKRICHVHNAKPNYPILHTLLKGLLNRSYTHAVATSTTAGRWLYGNADFTVLNNAIAVQDFAYDPAVRERMRNSLGLEDDVFSVGTVGRMNRDNPKNTGFLIRVFAEVHEMQPNTRLVIVGDGDLKKDWVALADNLGVSDSVMFEGFRTNIAEYMQAFDAFCFPSSWEGLGMVAIEAQAAGLPVLASDAVPTEVCLTEQLKFLSINDGDEVLWARELEALMKTLPDRESTRDSTLEQISNGGYDIRIEAGKLAKLYTSSPSY